MKLDMRKVQLFRSVTQRVKIDLAAATGSRKACRGNCGMFAWDVVQACNALLPKPYHLSVDAVQEGEYANSPELVIEVRMDVMVSRWHEALYLILMKIPFLRNRISGPCVKSYLIPSLLGAAKAQKGKE